MPTPINISPTANHHSWHTVGQHPLTCLVCQGESLDHSSVFTMDDSGLAILDNTDDGR